MVNKWREELDKELQYYINDLIKKTSFFPAFKKAERPALAQLWVALGLLSKRLYDQELKIKLLEGVLKEISPKKLEKIKSKEMMDKTKLEIERIMKEIAQRKSLERKKSKTSAVFYKPSKKGKKVTKKEIEELKKEIKRNF